MVWIHPKAKPLKKILLLQRLHKVTTPPLITNFTHMVWPANCFHLVNHVFFKCALGLAGGGGEKSWTVWLMKEELVLRTNRLNTQYSKYSFNIVLISASSTRKNHFPISQHVSASLTSISDLLPFKNASGDKAGRVKYLYWNLRSVRRWN